MLRECFYSADIGKKTYGRQPISREVILAPHFIHMAYKWTLLSNSKGEAEAESSDLG